MEGPFLQKMEGPDPLLTSSRGYACIFPQDADSPIWIPDRLIHRVSVPQAPGSPIASTTKKEGNASTSTLPCWHGKSSRAGDN